MHYEERQRRVRRLKSIGYAIVDFQNANILVYLTIAFVRWEFLWFADFDSSGRFFYLVSVLVVFLVICGWRHAPK